MAGTVPAREALIANSVPQTATVQRGKATLDVKYDGPAKFVPIEDTALSYAQNTPIPVIRVTPSSYYALQNAVWFAEQLPGAWTAATSVPAVIYTIPPSSPVHYVTYVRIYGSTPDVVYAGYTPGYMGTVVAPGGVVVYGTGYAYPAWVGSVWYPAPITYGIGARTSRVLDLGRAGDVGFGIGSAVTRRTGVPTRTARGSARGCSPGWRIGAAIGAVGLGMGLARRLQLHRQQRLQPLGFRDRPGARQHLQLHARRQHHGRSLRQTTSTPATTGNVYRNENGQWQKNESGNWNNVNRSQATRASRRGTSRLAIHAWTSISATREAAAALQDGRLISSVQQSQRRRRPR